MPRRRRNYPRDPYPTEARFRSKCAGCGMAIEKGEPIFYYPNEKRVFGFDCGCGDEAQADFAALSFDEDFGPR